ncbi:transposase [Halorarum salinum]|uniref:Transposase n=1 Tax=Halorarum salinum TaxID=2743089 RepID=A0A7D5QC62_9EURY|nr:transposase [Halobaculum salinum]QLG62819.1 transposase [Halobaculum salinum]
MADDVCGYEDTHSGEPCKRAAGWGRDADTGYCRTHADDDDADGPPAHRETKLTKERQEGIAAAIESGKSIASACRMHGIQPATFYNWMDRGEGEDEGPFADFFDRIVRAKGYGEDHYVQPIIEIAKEQGDLATLMSLLKQRYPDSWGDVDRGEQAGGITVTSEVVEISEDSPEVQ